MANAANKSEKTPPSEPSVETPTEARENVIFPPPPAFHAPRLGRQQQQPLTTPATNFAPPIPSAPALATVSKIHPRNNFGSNTGIAPNTDPNAKTGPSLETNTGPKTAAPAANAAATASAAPAAAQATPTAPPAAAPQNAPQTSTAAARPQNTSRQNTRSQRYPVSAQPPSQQQQIIYVEEGGGGGNFAKMFFIFSLSLLVTIGFLIKFRPDLLEKILHRAKEIKTEITTKAQLPQ
jgi:hypothetical protein